MCSRSTRAQSTSVRTSPQGVNRAPAAALRTARCEHPSASPRRVMCPQCLCARARVARMRIAPHLCDIVLGCASAATSASMHARESARFTWSSMLAPACHREVADGTLPWDRRRDGCRRSFTRVNHGLDLHGVTITLPVASLLAISKRGRQLSEADLSLLGGWAALPPDASVESARI